MRDEHPFVHGEGPTLLSRPSSGCEWWTFAGTRANATLAGELGRLCGGHTAHDALAITVEGAEGLSAVAEAIRELGLWDPATMRPTIDEDAVEGLKFAACLPRELGLAVLGARMQDAAAVREVLGQPLRVVSGA
jgi:ATP-dependent Lhr-like helicase